MNKLTRREREVLSLLIEGHSNKEIAQRVDRAEITVKTRLKSVYRKLGVKTRVQAVRVVFELAWAANTVGYADLSVTLKLVIWGDNNEHPNKP